SALLLTRQGLPVQPRDAAQLKAVAQGGYILKDVADPQLVLIGTGSEVQLAVGAAEKLAAEGVAVRVVSMPCVDRFERQDAAYQDAVLPKGVKTVAIEAGT
ncbi:transketolase, partial [Mycobacterium tuberculosis]|nr:transketolase [Mycobacterium tuberculosis]